MTGVRETVVKDHGKETLEKPHQRIDDNPSLEEYDFGGRDFWCESCRSKCTLGTDKQEYGHFRDCEHRNPTNLKGELHR